MKYASAQATGQWENYAKIAIDTIRKRVGSGKILLALSGGVDSSVVGAYLKGSRGDQLTCIFVDHGLMRKDEGDEVEAAFANSGMHFIQSRCRRDSSTDLRE